MAEAKEVIQMAEELVSRQDIVKLHSFVDESERREEQLVVLMRNLKTGEELEIPVNPHFLANLFPYV